MVLTSSADNFFTSSIYSYQSPISEQRAAVRVPGRGCVGPINHSQPPAGYISAILGQRTEEISRSAAFTSAGLLGVKLSQSPVSRGLSSQRQRLRQRPRAEPYSLFRKR